MKGKQKQNTDPRQLPLRFINRFLFIHLRFSEEWRYFVDAVQERLILTVQQGFQGLAVHI